MGEKYELGYEDPENPDRGLEGCGWFFLALFLCIIFYIVLYLKFWR